MAKYRGHDYAETIYGSRASDLILGLGGNDVLVGGKGNDTIYGGTGNDYLDGGEGADKLFGEAGNDSFIVRQNTVLIDGGAGYDRLNYGYVGAVEIDLSTGEATFESDGITYTSKFKGIENVGGSAGNDIIRGSDKGGVLLGASGDDLVEGGEGADALSGGRGTDTLRGGGGDDFLDFSSGNDILDGGEGSDTLELWFAKAGVTYAVSDTSLVLVDDEGSWTATLSSFENVRGTDWDDTLTGDSATNVLVGFAGNDTIFGLEGDDILCGAHGNDELTGGSGDDLFVFAYMDYATGEDDIITDFSVTDDDIMLDAEKFSGLTGRGATQQRGEFEFQALKASQFQNSTDFHAHNKNVRLIYESDTGVLYYDHDGSRAKIDAIEVAHLDPGLALTAADIFVGGSVFG